jgi:hypothetical protein
MRIDSESLARWREVDSTSVLQLIAEYSKEDITYRCLGAKGTTRWHASVGGKDFELLCNGAKFYDIRAEKGGGGAVDVIMHLLSLSFVDAARLLLRHSF